MCDGAYLLQKFRLNYFSVLSVAFPLVHKELFVLTAHLLDSSLAQGTQVRVFVVILLRA